MKENKRFKQTLFIFKICYLLYLLLAFNAFVNGTGWMNKASYVITVYGALLILWMIIQYKRYKKSYNLWILAAFTISYLISAATHISFGVSENIKGMIWLVFPFLLAYLSAFDMSGEEIRREAKVLSCIYIFYSTIANIVSISMVYWGRKFDYIDEVGTIHAIGYRWERLWGIYDDPNHGATITVIALFMLLYLCYLSKKLWQRIVLLLIFVINYTYLSLSDSRTGIISLTFGIFIAGFLALWIKRKNKGRHKPILLLIFTSLFAAGVLFAGDLAIKKVYQPIDKKIIQELKAKNPTPTQPAGKDTRKNDLQHDYSNGRVEIWRNGMQIVKESPLVGVGYRNIVSYAKAHFPEGYLVKNAFGVQYDSMHNLELDILTAQGALGGIVFLFLMGNICIILYKKIHLTPRVYQGDMIFSASVSGALLIAGTFLSFIFYVNAPQNLCFWLFLGYTMRFCQIGAEEKI
jgi:O-antigen ligase